MDHPDAPPPPELGLMFAIGRHRLVPAGAVVVPAGSAPTDVAYVRAGGLVLERAGAHGRTVALGQVGPGGLVGVAATIDGGEHPVTARALTRSSLVLIDAVRFLRLVDERPVLARHLVHILAADARRSTDRAVEFALQDALGRLCRRLAEALDEARTVGGPPGTVELPGSQAEVAEHCGLSREAVVKGLRALRTLGWVDGDGDGRRFRVLDEAAVRHRARP